MFSLLNTLGVYTRFPFTTNHRPAVLDLSFTTSALLPYFSSWNPSLLPTGSDQTALLIVLSTPLLKPPPRGLNSKHTDRDHLSPLLAELALAAPLALTIPHTLNLWFDYSLARITQLITSNTPSKLPSSYSKPWWTPEVTQLRRIHHPTTRLIRKNQASPPRLAWLEALISSLYNPLRDSSGPSPWLMPGELLLAELRTVSQYLKMPPLPPKLTIPFFNTFFPPDPHLLHLSYLRHLRMFALFHHQKCPQRFESPPILTPLTRAASLTLSGSESTRPMSDSCPLFLLFSLPMDITLNP